MHNTQAPARNTARTTGPYRSGTAAPGSRLVHATGSDAFGWFLDWQSSQDISGDLVELVCARKSAILMGTYLKGDETLVVCDLFGRAAGEEDIGATPVSSTRTASADRTSRRTTSGFSRHFHVSSRVPRQRSSTTCSQAPPAFCTSTPRTDMRTSVRTLLLRGPCSVRRGRWCWTSIGRRHTPGVAAAVWGAVLRDGLIPLCVSESKF